MYNPSKISKPPQVILTFGGLQEPLKTTPRKITYTMYLIFAQTSNFIFISARSSWNVFFVQIKKSSQIFLHFVEKSIIKTILLQNITSVMRVSVLFHWSSQKSVPFFGRGGFTTFGKCANNKIWWSINMFRACGDVAGELWTWLLEPPKLELKALAASDGGNICSGFSASTVF